MAVVLLTLFALVAGAATALSPCVLPVLPAVLSAGVTGGRRRPLGVATGLALAFTFATVALVYLIDALGLPDDLLRTVAIVVLAVFGITLLVPPLSDRVEAFATRLTGGPRGVGGEGFLGGLVLGASLGFVYAPCAGPILASVITVSASQPFTADKLIIAFAYGVGSAAVIYAILLGGRRVTDHLGPVKGRVNIAMGAVMLVAAVALLNDFDIRFNSWLADNAPAAFSNPTKAIEESSAIKDDLASVRGGEGSEEAGEAEASSGRTLPVLARAPGFRDNQRWFNTPGDRPLSIPGLRGKVVLIDFWTYTCINCLRTLPHVEAWYRRYARDGLVVVGVHTPEFPFEKDAGNVEQAIAANGLTYPVAQDNEYGTWDAYRNQYWPAKYLIDSRGRVRYVHFGEGDYGTTEQAIRSLLAERGDRALGGGTSVRAETPSHGVTTPESYLGAARAETVVNGPLLPGVGSYRLPAGARLPPDLLAYEGVWRISAESAAAVRDSRIELNFGARRVFLVLGSPRGPRSLRVLLDGRPIPDRLAGDDVHGGVATIDEQRLYRLVDLPHVGRHTLTLKFSPGISGYAFTFG
jgi:cytochrome c biogenesis protein CcdA/thiol-disulfide isomerase/thioredoxin